MPDPADPKNDDGDPQFTTVSDLNFTYQPINPTHPGTVPTSWKVQPGDTLQTIARQVYGDSAYWYRIADANGITGRDALQPNQALTLPPLANTTYNRADSMRPYESSVLIGDTTPNLPPPDKGGCGILQILVIVIAVVATVATAGAAAAAMGAASTAAGATGVMSLGAAAMTGGTLLGAAGAAGTVGATLGVGIGIASAAIGAVVGSIVGQGVAMAVGIQDRFSWKSVALSAVSAGVASSVGAAASAASGWISGATLTPTVARAVIANALTQGIGVATGLQEQFSWRSVAAAGLATGVGYMMGEALGMQTQAYKTASFAERLTKSTLTGLVAGATAAIARGGRVTVQQVAVDAFGNALGESMVEASRGDTARDSMTAQEKFHRLEIEAMNEEARIANVLARSRPGISEEDYWNVPPRTEAKRYADTYGGEVVNTADRLRLSSGNPGEPLPEITDPRITRTRLLADEYNALKVAQASRNGEDLAPTLNNAARLGLYDTSGDGMPIKATPEENPISNLASRFGSGLVHGAIDMVWQPVAQTIDLGQAAIGFVSGGRYEPTWLSGIGRNYDAGMSYGESMTRAVLGSNPVTGVGMASYDLTSSAMQGDWGGVAEGAGGLVGGFAAGKYGQRWMAPQPGAQLGVYRVRPQVEITNPLVDPGGLLPPPPEWDAPNFTSAAPVYLGDKPLYRVSDGVFGSRVQSNANGAYWADRPAPATEAQWRSTYAVLNEWPNRGSTEGVWVPDGGWGWGGKAAPQASLQSAKDVTVLGFTYRYGWIQPGGGYQIMVPDSYTTIPHSNIQLGPTPWRK